MKLTIKKPVAAAFALATAAQPFGLLLAQTEEAESEIFELSPFEVSADESDGYRATHTLAGTRLRTELKDVGSAISVITDEFLQDTASTDNQSLLVYTTGTEVAGPGGNFSGASEDGQESFQNTSGNTRVRGLSRADNTLDFFLTNIPWDSYIVDRVDVQRGPNSILFGFGSPAGIINATRIRPNFGNDRKVELRFDNEGSLRTAIDVNQVILEDELSIRFAALNDLKNFRQDPAFEDDRRLFAAVKYEPKFLRSESMRTTFNGSYENGDIDANRPRMITPKDHITSWFRPVQVNGEPNPEGGLGKGAWGPVQTHLNTPQPGRAVGQRQPAYADGTPNPDFLPALGPLPQSFGNLHYYLEGDIGSADSVMQTEPQTVDANGIGPNGEIDGDISGLPLQHFSAPEGLPQIARILGLPGSDLGQVRNVHLTDPTIFDFWNNLLDGPNKSETQKWNHYTASFSQSFLNNKLGYEVSYDRQDYEQARVSRAFSAARNTIYIDVNSELGDGSPNPNVGRPFITDTGMHNNGSDRIEREAARLTAFAEMDFTGGGTDSWFRKLLGRHVGTALLSEEESDTLTQSWANWGTTDAFGERFGAPSIEAFPRQISPIVYLGPSMFDRDSASGAYLQGVKSEITFPDTIQARLFDSTWNAPEVDPAALWLDVNGDGVFDPQADKAQSENPANYVGWTEGEVRILQAKDGFRDELTDNLDRDISDTSSEALVLQSHFWDGAVVGTYGWRRDVNKAFNARADQDETTKRILFDTLVLPDEPNNTIETQSKSWSIAVHANELFGLDRLPFNLSLYYNESENFQPAAGRIDIYGRPFNPPQGNTIDRSVLISTKDDKYSLRATRFTTTVTNDSANDVGNTWAVGQFQNRGDNAANRFEFDIAGQKVGVPNFGNTYQPRPGQTPEEAAAEEAEAVAGWRNLQQELAALTQELAGDPKAFYTAWGSDPDVTPPDRVSVLRRPAGFAITQDAVSTGYEFELTARPVRNWRVAVNASKNEAVRNNIGGEAFIRHVELMEDLLLNTPAGNLRVQNGGANNETVGEQWTRIFAGNWELTKLLEGSNTPELREWRFNLVTNYSFQDGALKGWNVGGGYRWQDDVVIGYPVIDDGEGGSTFDLANPYSGPAEDDVDLWVGYRRKLGDKVDWRVQFNVRSVFADKELIPVSTQPDGTPAVVRLGPTTSWTLSNTFSF